VKKTLASTDFATEVKKDVKEAQQIGVRGVPFFVFNRKYAVSGAQPSDTFLQALQKSHTEWRHENPAPLFEEVGNGPVCTPDGECQ